MGPGAAAWWHLQCGAHTSIAVAHPVKSMGSAPAGTSNSLPDGGVVLVHAAVDGVGALNHKLHILLVILQQDGSKWGQGGGSSQLLLTHHRGGQFDRAGTVTHTGMP